MLPSPTALPTAARMKPTRLAQFSLTMSSMPISETLSGLYINRTGRETDAGRPLAPFEFLALGDDGTVDHPDCLHVQKLDDVGSFVCTVNVRRLGEVFALLAVAVF
jgi:hypothetical protein